MNIFLDLDGPILDNSCRLYRLHTDLLHKFGKKPLSMQKYWSLKRECVPESIIIKGILNNNIGTIDKYLKEREKLIESRHYLKLNKIVNGCLTTLGFLRRRGKLFLVTTRKRQNNLMWELRQNNIKNFFSEVLCGFEKSISPWKVKERLIKKSGLKNYDRGIIIGDTEAEIICAKNIGLLSIAVTNGIRKKERLVSLGPDIVCKDIRDVIQKWHLITKTLKGYESII